MGFKLPTKRRCEREERAEAEVQRPKKESDCCDDEVMISSTIAGGAEEKLSQLRDARGSPS